MADTNLAQAVEATHDSSSYDTNVKFLLAELEGILKSGQSHWMQGFQTWGA